MRNDNAKPTKQQTRRARQEAVAINHRDMSTDEIAARINHHNTLISLYEAQRASNQKVVVDATAGLKTADRMLEELRADVATLSGIVKSRRC
jgi:ribosome-binding protein aMBF1 (putative translation factor)